MQPDKNSFTDKVGKSAVSYPVLQYFVMTSAVYGNCVTSKDTVLEWSTPRSRMMWSILFSVIKYNTCILLMRLCK